MGRDRMVTWMPVSNWGIKICLLFLKFHILDFFIKAAEVDVVGKVGIRKCSTQGTEYFHCWKLGSAFTLFAVGYSSSPLTSLMFLDFPKLDTLIAGTISALETPWLSSHSHTAFQLGPHCHGEAPFPSPWRVNNKAPFGHLVLILPLASCLPKQWGTFISTCHLDENNCYQILESLLTCPNLAQETLISLLRPTKKRRRKKFF